MSARLTILGCGGSMAVPMWGNSWGKCDPNNPKNRRLRTSAMVDYQGKRFLIDTAPDLRFQALEHNIQAVDGVLYTHTHSDHIGGIDELRALYILTKQQVNIYGNQETLDEIEKRFPYLVHSGDVYKSFMNFHTINVGLNNIQDVAVTALALDHVICKPFGYRFGDIAYTTDIKNIPEESLQSLKGVRYWVISCPFLSNAEHPTHAGLPQVIEWIDTVKPEKSYLTHLGQNMDYDDLVKLCPPNVEPCYDSMVIG